MGHQESVAGAVVRKVNKLNLPTSPPSTSFSGAVARECSAIGSEAGKDIFLFLLFLSSVLMDSSVVGSLLVRSRPTTVVVSPTY